MAMRITELPSPRGTNREGCYLVEGAPSRHAATMAMDAINRGIAVDRRGARDQHEGPPAHRSSDGRKHYDAMCRDIGSLFDQMPIHASHRGMIEDRLAQYGRDAGFGSEEYSEAEIEKAKDKVYGDSDEESPQSWLEHEDRPKEIEEPDGADEAEAEAQGHGAGEARRFEAGTPRGDRRANDRRRRGGRDHALGMDYASARESADAFFGLDRIKNAY
jgi:hypothetical protein